MVILATIILALMAAVNYVVGGRRLLSPPVVFCTVWAADLLLVWSAGDFFFPLSDKTLVIFCCGGLAFSLGSSLSLLIRENKALTQPEVFNRVVTFLVFLIALSFPLAYNFIVNLTSGVNAPTVLMAARIAMLDADAAGNSSILFGGLITLSLIVAAIAFLENEKNKVRSIIAITLAIALNLLTGGRSGIITLIFAMICIGWLKVRRIRWKPLLVLSLLFVLVFGAMAILIQKGEANANATVLENVRPVAEGFVLYAGGGIVGIDRVVRQPNIIPHNWQINKFFLETANKIGFRYEPPSQHSEFVDLGPYVTGNVYSMYFAYLDLGYGGIMLVTGCVGFGVGFCFKKALQGSKTAMVLYSFLFGGILLSPFSENFFMGLNFLTKLYAVSWLVYSLPARRAQFLLVLSRLNHRFVPHGAGVIAPSEKTD
jgi:oligosaccharide repeat unit polymerase